MSWRKPIGKLPNPIQNSVAKETINTVKNGFYMNSLGEKVDVSEMVKMATELSELKQPDETYDNSNVLKDRAGVIEITEEFSLDATQRLVKDDIDTACLVFASARNPGGGFCGRNEAQEENIARSSSLYFTQIKHPEMYNYNREQRSLLYSDYMIYSPNVPVWRTTKYELLDKPYCVSFITSPACNLSRKVPDDAKDVMFNRCRKILDLAVSKEAKGIVLGLFGCGVFGNKIENVAGYFKRLLIDEGYAKYFDKVVFPCGRKMNIFKEAFNNQQ